MNPQIVLLCPQGRLDALMARQLDTDLQQHLRNGQARLIVDFKNTRYISSHGLRVLLEAQKQARENGGGLKLCSLSPRLIEIFEMAGFDRVFEIFETAEQAEQAFAL
jgi:anti-sigma B factor antagonist